METAEIRFDAEGVPVAFVVDGREWIVGAEPLRWFERVPWWNTARSMSLREGKGRIDVKVWRLQGRLGRNPSSELVTFELVEDVESGWVVRSRS